MRNALWVSKAAVLCAVLALAGCARPEGSPTQARSEPAQVQEVSIEAAEKMLAWGNVHVIDNNLELYYRTGHLRGAKLLWYDDVKADVLPADKAANLLFYCKNPQCTAAPTAAKKAIELGYTNVFVMPAGIEGWVQAGKPVVKEGPEAQL